jgi:hypothetical protein
MASYRIFHNLSEDKRITTCNNDLELIQFVNRIQTENEDDLTYDVDSAIDYINFTCDNLDFVSDHFDGSEEYQFCVDQKHTIWYRSYFTVNAMSYEDATEKVSQMFRDDVLPTDNWDIIFDTTEEMTLEDNGGASTIEIYTEDGDLVLQNGE